MTSSIVQIPKTIKNCIHIWTKSQHSYHLVLHTLLFLLINALVYIYIRPGRSLGEKIWNVLKHLSRHFCHAQTLKLLVVCTSVQCTYILFENTPLNFRVCAWRKFPAKRFKICYILKIRKPKVAFCSFHFVLLYFFH